MTEAKRLSISVMIAFGIAILSTNESNRGIASSDTIPSQASVKAVSDVDGNKYSTVAIGNQIWMVENLKVTRYRDGTQIPRVEDDKEWAIVDIGAWCRPALDPSMEIAAYGLLYNYRAVSDCRGLCPDGWHVPTAAEWRELIGYLGGAGIAGGKMKVTSAGSWSIQPLGTTNESGFSALPAGGRGRLSGAGEAGNYATWWSSTQHDSLYAWHWGLHPDKHEIRYNPGHVQSGFSVRCIKNGSSS
jgi:uncharacterized protein (TIGR02145 family)